MLTTDNPLDKLDWLRELIRSRRKARKLSRAELAKHCGLTPQIIATIENGGQPASVEILRRVIDCLPPQE